MEDLCKVLYYEVGNYRSRVDQELLCLLISNLHQV